MNPDNYTGNYRWPVSGGKWNQAYFVRPVITDNTAFYDRRVRLAAGDDTNARPDWEIAGVGPQNTLVREANTFYSQVVASINAIDQAVSGGNIVPSQLSCNHWPYADKTSTVTAPVAPTKRAPANDPNFVDISRYLNLTSSTDNLFPGSEATVTSRQPILEVEIPFYENTRFEVVNNTTNNTSNVSAHSLSILQEKERTPGATNLQNVVYNTSNGTQLETAATLERWVKPGADFALFYLLNAPTIYYNDKFVYRETVPAYAGDYAAGWEAGPPKPYSDLQYIFANRSETSLPGYRIVSLYNPTLGGSYQPASMYVNLDPSLPYYTSVAPDQSSSYYLPVVSSSVI
jgi:hypothetical protein